MSGSAQGLIDRFGRRHNYLRISLTDRCNLRCTYCMPANGIDWTPQEQLLTTPEILRLAQLFVSLEIDKIRLTGGEPLMNRDIKIIVEHLARLPGLRTLALTTNALKLGGMAQELRQNGLSSVTISLDSLKEDVFAAMTRRRRLADVMRGIEAAIAAGFDPVKINIVVMNNVNDGEILDFVEWGKDKPVDLRFIEYMPFPDTQWKKAGLLPYAEMRSRIDARYPLEAAPGSASDVGKSYRVGGHRAMVSFISSMTESFCGSCNRLRLTADGNIKACLFHPAEKSLRDVMRAGGSDGDLKQVIFDALQGKPEAHAQMDELLAIGNRTMIAIGG